MWCGHGGGCGVAAVEAQGTGSPPKAAQREGGGGTRPLTDGGKLIKGDSAGSLHPRSPSLSASQVEAAGIEVRNLHLYLIPKSKR